MTALTYEIASSLLRLDCAEGRMFWLIRPPELFQDKRCANVWNARHGGKEAFTAIDGCGYLHGAVNYRKYKAHRLVWLLHYGEWPDGDLDHINGVTTDNRVENLRVVSHAENCKNRKTQSNNKSGVTGVFWNTRAGKFHALISSNGSRIHLGFFDDLEKAMAARKAAELQHNFHANYGRAR